MKEVEKEAKNSTNKERRFSFWNRTWRRTTYL